MESILDDIRELRQFLDITEIVWLYFLKDKIIVSKLILYPGLLSKPFSTRSGKMRKKG